ncbi:hypothetical protein Xmau_00177 [Xenorhabdus mauleonii]|uniref:Uncharacterized protein n=1 Tax=Xenorhabdus mauleonii TaxID=351675 RepID=A0A1I3N477_9GAMM|nr:hypothetical protein [Xenorhabdus mauleonii]PHM45789.1 hypothetical protein Xmau_00177 [Xenorhabdus mauleonii]SFJ03942.1 hypothetical protein SAMN05421680_10583 [Xenorhabdus mauleonii]
MEKTTNMQEVQQLDVYDCIENISNGVSIILNATLDILVNKRTISKYQKMLISHGIKSILEGLLTLISAFILKK